MGEDIEIDCFEKRDWKKGHRCMNCKTFNPTKHEICRQDKLARTKREIEEDIKKNGNGGK